MAQVVEHLPSKHKALSSNPSTTPVKKKKPETTTKTTDLCLKELFYKERLSIKHRHRLETTEKAIFKLSLDVTKKEIEVS
jgi:hypothetical protein